MFKAQLAFAVFLMMLSITAGALEDPTAPPMVQKSVPVIRSIKPLPVLTSIVYSEQRKLAVVNGHLLGEGERKGGIALLAIEPDNVRIRVGTARQVTLKMRSGLIKKELK